MSKLRSTTVFANQIKVKVSFYFICLYLQNAAFEEAK